MTDIVERLRSGAAHQTHVTTGLVNQAADTITALRAEVDQYDRSFDLRRAADMRAIKRWQAAHPGNDLNWPDHADLVVWLLERDAALRAEVERLKVENEAVLSANRDVMLHWDVLKADYEKLRAALKIARPFIGWAGHYPTILAEVDAALEGPQDRMAEPLEEKP